MAKGGQTLKQKILESDRIIALDIIRGYFIIIIASVHLAYYPSIFGYTTGQGRLWVSEADGFFFISGLLVGIIRHREMIKNGLRSAQRKTFSRGLKLYITSVVLSIIFSFIGRLTTYHGIPGAKYGLDVDDSFRHIVWQTITFQHSYGWTDFLIYYAVFLMIAPLVLWLFSKRLWWFVLGAVIVIWMICWSGAVTGWVQGFLLWQAPFFIGAIIGFHWHELLGRFHALSYATQRFIGNALIVGAVAIFVLGYIFVLIPEYFSDHGVPAGSLHTVITQTIHVYENPLYNDLVLNARTGLIRPLLLLIVVGGLFTFVRRYEKQIVKWLGWLLIPFGKNSLYAYILEGIIIFAIPYFFNKSHFILINTAVEALIIAIVWFAIKKQFLFKIIPR